MGDIPFYQDKFDTHLVIEVTNATTLDDLDESKKRAHTVARTALHDRWDTQGKYLKGRRRHHETELIRFTIDERLARRTSTQGASFEFIEAELTAIKARLDDLEA
jgi:hypothetical protein